MCVLFFLSLCPCSILSYKRSGNSEVDDPVVRSELYADCVQEKHKYISAPEIQQFISINFSYNIICLSFLVLHTLLRSETFISYYDDPISQ